MPELIVYGLVLGSIIALGTIGFTLSTKIADFCNYSHGDLMTVGAYIALLVSGTLLSGSGFLQGRIGPFSFGWGLLLSFLPAILVTAGLAILIDRLVYRPLRRLGAPSIHFDMVSLGIAFALRGVIYVIWGADYHFYFSGVRP